MLYRKWELHCSLEECHSLYLIHNCSGVPIAPHLANTEIMNHIDFNIKLAMRLAVI